MNEPDKSFTSIDPGIFGFLQVGWWVFHVVAIAGLLYLGYLYGSRMFG